MSEQREAVDSALRVNNYCVDCEETSKWIMDKTKVVESTKDLGQDLAGVIAIQRKLSGLERDVLAIRDRVSALERESQYLMESHPECQLACLLTKVLTTKLCLYAFYCGHILPIATLKSLEAEKIRRRNI